MPWFKVDDNLAFHHKVVAAGNPAIGLWARAGSLCAQQLTDGFVPDHMIAAMGTTAQARRLVEVGLWDRAEGGYTFHGWAERQPSKAHVEAERAAAAERTRLARERKRQASRGESEQVSGSRAEGVRANGGRTSPEVPDVFGNPDPTRPDPTRPTREQEASSDKSDQTSTPERFDEFWETYGNKVGRAKCETAYRVALRKSGVTADLLIAAADAYVLWCRETDTFIKNPLTWLHGEHWRDERTARQAPRSNVQQHVDLARRLAEQDGATIHEIGSSR